MTSTTEHDEVSTTTEHARTSFKTFEESTAEDWAIIAPQLQITQSFVAERVIGEWIEYYNTARPHSALDGQTPAEAYSTGRPVDMMDNASALPTSPQAQQPQKAFNMNRILAA